MKSVGVITIHYGVNHGSALQSFALCTYLKKIGCDAHLINYIPPRYRFWNEYFQDRKKRHSIFAILAFYPIYCLREMPNRLRFKRFTKKFLPLTREYRTNKELLKKPPQFDLYLVGSDQVWNMDYNGLTEKSYFLNFVSDSNKKNAYASSFGKSYPLSSEEMDFIIPFLKDFRTITVREKDGVDILNSAGIVSTHVVDPVFLLNRQEWMSFCSDNISKFPKNKEYILVYVMDGEYERLFDVASRFSKKMNCPIYAVSFTKIVDSRIEKCFYDFAPQGFVDILSKASLIVTNSFHGTAFSVLFGKRFIVCEKGQYNSRMRSLLQRINCQRRCIAIDQQIDENIVSSIIGSNDLIKASIILEEWIKNSKAILNKMIKC